MYKIILLIRRYSVSMLNILLLSVIIRCMDYSVLANQYDPHLFPEEGPFVEGWYLRFIDHSTDRMFGFVLGTILPTDQPTSHHLAFVGLLNGKKDHKLLSYSSFPTLSDFNITVDGGHRVSRDPDMSSPAKFDIVVLSHGHMSVRNNEVIIDITVENIHFEARIGPAVPWGPGGYGPEGWLQYLGNILPLHWFVYSIRSPVLYYKWSDYKTGKSLQGHKGIVHMEKNWGESFPTAWIWTQGISSTDNEIMYALSFGPLTFSFVEVTGFLFGYRNPQKAININFTPVNSFPTKSYISGCDGSVSFTITGLFYSVTINVHADNCTFSDCLYCPEDNGFRPASIESFTADAEIVIHQRKFLWSFYEIDRQLIKGYAALEFGGSYLCGNLCSNLQ